MKISLCVYLCTHVPSMCSRAFHENFDSRLLTSPYFTTECRRHFLTLFAKMLLVIITKRGQEEENLKKIFSLNVKERKSLFALEGSDIDRHSYKNSSSFVARDTEKSD